MPPTKKTKFETLLENVKVYENHRAKQQFAATASPIAQVCCKRDCNKSGVYFCSECDDGSVYCEECWDIAHYNEKTGAWSSHLKGPLQYSKFGKANKSADKNNNNTSADSAVNRAKKYREGLKIAEPFRVTHTQVDDEICRLMPDGDNNPLVWIVRWIPNGLDGQPLNINYFIANIFYAWYAQHPDHADFAFILWEKFISQHKKYETILSMWPEADKYLDFKTWTVGTETLNDQQRKIIVSSRLNDPAPLIEAAKAQIYTGRLIYETKTVQHNNNFFLSEMRNSLKTEVNEETNLYYKPGEAEFRSRLSPPPYDCAAVCKTLPKKDRVHNGKPYFKNCQENDVAAVAFLNQIMARCGDKVIYKSLVAHAHFDGQISYEVDKPGRIPLDEGYPYLQVGEKSNGKRGDEREVTLTYTPKIRRWKDIINENPNWVLNYSATGGYGWFDPSSNYTKETWGFNFFRGFYHDPDAPYYKVTHKDVEDYDVKPIIKWLKEYACHDDDPDIANRLFIFLCGSLHRMINFPGERITMDFCFEGKKGAGKSRMVEMFKIMLGDEYCETFFDPNQMTDRFNKHRLCNKLLVHCDEAASSNIKEGFSKKQETKAITTESFITVEKKNVNTYVAALTHCTFYTTDRKNAQSMEANDRRTQCFRFREPPTLKELLEVYTKMVQGWAHDMTVRKRAKAMGAALFKWFKYGILETNFFRDKIKKYPEMFDIPESGEFTITNLNTRYIIKSARRKILILGSFHPAATWAYQKYRFVALEKMEGKEVVPAWSPYKKGTLDNGHITFPKSSKPGKRLIKARDFYDLFKYTLGEKERGSFHIELFIAIVSRTLNWDTPVSSDLETFFEVEEDFVGWEKSSF